MTIHPPKHILCAVRSRPGAEETVQRAINLALESGAKLTFCQIVDTDFVDRFSLRGSSRKAAYQEITEMAEFALMMIRDQAKREGVSDVDTVIRTGGVRRTLHQLVDELGIDMLVLGRPKKMATQDVFNQKRLDAFVAGFEEKGVQVSR
jgi:nucleotide-binding universal stress UspA family protein